MILRPVKLMLDKECLRCDSTCCFAVLGSNKSTMALMSASPRISIRLDSSGIELSKRGERGVGCERETTAYLSKISTHLLE